jgi:hypothetical protein
LSKARAAASSRVRAWPAGRRPAAAGLVDAAGGAGGGGCGEVDRACVDGGEDGSQDGDADEAAYLVGDPSMEEAMPARSGGAPLMMATEAATMTMPRPAPAGTRPPGGRGPARLSA